MDVIKKENKLCYMMGDYNINILNYDVHAPTGEFVDTMSSYAFVPLINRPTRVTAASATLIDNIFTNNFGNLEILFKVSWWLIYLTIIPFSTLIVLTRLSKLQGL